MGRERRIAPMIDGRVPGAGAGDNTATGRPWLVIVTGSPSLLLDDAETRGLELGRSNRLRHLVLRWVASVHLKRTESMAKPQASFQTVVSP